MKILLIRRVQVRRARSILAEVLRARGTRVNSGALSVAIQLTQPLSGEPLMCSRLLVLAAGLVAGCAGLAKGADSPQSEITRIFNAAESTGGDGKSSSTAAYLRLAKLRPAAGADRRVKYAYLVSLVHCKKPKEALAFATSLVNSQPDYLPARRIRARLLLRDREFDEVFAELDAIGQQLAKEQQSAALSIDTESSCRLLGLAFGYLEGPAKPIVKETIGAGVKARVLKQLSPEHRKLFDEQYQMVQAEYRELTTNGEKAFEELRAKNQTLSQDADKQRATLVAEQQKVEAQLEQERTRLRADWDTTHSQYAKVAETFTSIRAEMVSLGNQRALAAGQLATIAPPRPDKYGNVDQTSMRIYNQRMASLQTAVFQFDQQFARNQVELEKAWQQGAALETQLNSLIQKGERLGESFELERQDFAKAGKKIKAAPKSKKPPAFKQRGQSFATYDDFSFAMEKQRLLGSLQSTS
jgi:hypothetical protein